MAVNFHTFIFMKSCSVFCITLTSNWYNYWSVKEINQQSYQFEYNHVIKKISTTLTHDKESNLMSILELSSFYKNCYSLVTFFIYGRDLQSWSSKSTVHKVLDASLLQHNWIKWITCYQAFSKLDGMLRG